MDTKSTAPIAKAMPPNKTDKTDKTGREPISQREAVYQEVIKILRQDKIVLALNQAAKSAMKEEHFKSIVSAIASGCQAT